MNTKDKILMLFCTMLFFSFIAAGSAMAEKHYLYYNEQRFEYTLDSTSKITNPQLDSDGILQNASIERGILANKSYFNAKIENYIAIEFTVLDEESNAIDLVPLANTLNAWLINPTFYIFCLFLSFVCFRAYFYLMHEPWILARKYDTLQKINIGRLSKEEPLNNESGLWRYIVKSSNGIIHYYSDRSFSEYAPFLFEKFMGVLHYYPDLIVLEIDIPKEAKIQNYEFKQTTKNKVLKIFYRICIGLSLIRWAIKLFDLMEKSDEPLTKIKFITSIYLMEHLDLRFNVKYQKFELDQNGIENWVEHTATNITLAECLAIQKNASKIKEFQYIEFLPDFKKMRTTQDCFKDLRSRMLDRGYFESQKIWYEHQVEATYKLYQQVAEELTTMKMTEEERFHEMYSKIEAVNTDRNNTFPELLSKYAMLRTMSDDDKLAMRKTMTDLIENKLGAEAKQVNQENAILKAKIDIYQQLVKEKLEKMDKNEINIRRIDPKTEDEKK